MGLQLQHYVPKFLIKQFGAGKPPYVHVYDKHLDTRFKLATNKDAEIPVAAEKGMYDFEFMGTPVSMEPALSELESEAAECIRRIVRDGKLHPSDAREKQTLALFIVVQMIRTRATLEANSDVFGRMRRWCEAQGAPDAFFAPDPHVGDGKNAEKAFMAKQLSNAHTDYAPSLIGKDWLLLRTPEKEHFLLSDHPVVMHNDIERPGRGNLGINVEGIQIQIPLTPTYALGLWCPSLLETVSKGVSKMATLRKPHPFQDTASRHNLRRARETLHAFRNNLPLQYESDNVLHLNSLQVSHAERFVFSSTGDFTLVEEMIGGDQSIRHGRRFEETTGKF